jgi:hypothetical protein
LSEIKKLSHTGLPDGMFSNPKTQFGQILEGLGTEKVGMFCAHLEYTTAIWYILRPFGNLVAIWYIFSLFGKLCQEKSGNAGHTCEAKTVQNCQIALVPLHRAAELSRHLHVRLIELSVDFIRTLR